MLSGNTDCYQPIERKTKLTRTLLTSLLQFKHPTGIITKNHLICRDLDLLKELNQLNLLRIIVSITSINENTRRVMEPRTSSIKQKLMAIEKLSNAGIKVHVNFAPLIPSINCSEGFELARSIGSAGANSASQFLDSVVTKTPNLFLKTGWKRISRKEQKR